MKFGGTSVAGPEDLKRAAARIVAERERGNKVVAVLSARGKTTDELVTMAARDLRAAEPARDGHAALDRRADLLRALRDGDLGPRPPGDLADRLAGGDRHRLLAHEGADHRRPRRPDQRGARGRQHRPRRRLPGRLDRLQGRDDARPRRLRHDRGRARRGARTPSVCEIYTDVAGVFSADPRIVPDARKLRVVSFEEMLEMSASGREGAAAAQRRVRPQPRRPDPLPLVVRGGHRYPRGRRGRDHGEPASSQPSPTPTRRRA